MHGTAERDAAELAGRALFGRGELAELPAATLGAALRELAAPELSRVDGQLPLVTDAMAASKVAESKSAARRAITEGGAYLNNRKVTEVDARITEDDLLAGRWVVLRRGKRHVGGVGIV